MPGDQARLPVEFIRGRVWCDRLHNIGQQTTGRPWTRYEIVEAWNKHKSLVGVRINGLADPAAAATARVPTLKIV